MLRVKPAAHSESSAPAMASGTDSMMMKRVHETLELRRQHQENDEDRKGEGDPYAGGSFEVLLRLAIETQRCCGGSTSAACSRMNSIAEPMA